jgi:hypothetical protein
VLGLNHSSPTSTGLEALRFYLKALLPVSHIASSAVILKRKNQFRDGEYAPYRSCTRGQLIPRFIAEGYLVVSSVAATAGRYFPDFYYGRVLVLFGPLIFGLKGRFFLTYCLSHAYADIDIEVRALPIFTPRLKGLSSEMDLAETGVNQ